MHTTVNFQFFFRVEYKAEMSGKLQSGEKSPERFSPRSWEAYKLKTNFI